ncbi:MULTISPECIES: TetR family transcriptional regulator [unclassified Ensifer]|uniref:TetR family transcriptional regulator n=1 Tax=unclassified Ensifer TaxID=2633371 RepID=UPI0008136141|nr:MULTISPECIES: TetR family transcriptional regulator [unclassified Ensifer]OCO98752.1 TetR family transcriptional regulator [Ensifer sp. LC14]OCP13231.1 TetR family transcriptional regulator [Ensifer sp. LC13]OCP13834.1 TetR family transcriptional regulator [Ensifer sp. LC11]OCP28212.1 TetR family transcriptional regulator [Ensifer sp. LC499]
MRRTKADAEATRQKILGAAERVFYEKGVSNTTLDEIAKVAGVTRGAIYWHFANKTDLFLALHDAVPLPQEDMVAREIEAEAADTLSILEGAMGDWLDVLAADEQRQRILTIMLRTNYDGDMSEVLTRQKELDERHNVLLELAFSRALAKGQMHESWTPASATRTLHWMMLGLCTEWLLFGRRFDLTADGREGLSRLFASFRAPAITATAVAARP